MANPNLAVSRLSLSVFTDLVHSKTGAAGTANFTGGAPDGVITTGPSKFIWAEGADQGLIDPQGLGVNHPVRVLRVTLFMTGQSTWKLDFIDGSSVGTLVSGTTETFWSDEAMSFLTPGQKLRLTTTGAGTTAVKMICTVVDPYQFSPAGKGV